MFDLIAAVSLLWNVNQETNLAGYKVYQGGNSGTYTNSRFVGGSNSNRVQGIVSGRTYYFVVTAILISGAESNFSNEVQCYEPWRMTVAPCPPGVSLAFETMIGSSYVVESSQFLDLPWFGWTDRYSIEGTGGQVEFSFATLESMEVFRVRTKLNNYVIYR